MLDFNPECSPVDTCSLLQKKITIEQNNSLHNPNIAFNIHTFPRGSCRSSIPLFDEIAGSYTEFLYIYIFFLQLIFCFCFVLKQCPLKIPHIKHTYLLTGELSGFETNMKILSEYVVFVVVVCLLYISFLKKSVMSGLKN